MTDYTEATNYIEIAQSSRDHWFKDRALMKAAEEIESLKKQLDQAARESEGGEAVPVAWWDGDLEEIGASFERHRTAYHTIPVYDLPAPKIIQRLEDRIISKDNYIGFLKAQKADLKSKLATPQPDKWILCTERLPTEACEALLDLGGKVVNGAWIAESFWYSNAKVSPVAWMPRPAPFSGGGND